MRVAITIITRDRAAVLPRALESALGQDYPDKAVCLLDDASGDRTPSLRERYPGVRWERSDTRMGIPEARNRLMGSCGADLVVGLDDDAWFLDHDAVSAGVAAMSADPRIGAIAFDVISAGREARRARGAPEPWHAFQGCGHMLRMSALREVGMYPLGPGWYGAEEKDLCLRLLDAGHGVVRLPGIHVWHDKVAEGRDVLGLHASGVCNDLALVLRRFPTPMVLWWLPVKIVSHLYFSIRVGLMGPCVRGIGLFFASWRPLLEARAPVRAGAIREYMRRSKSGPTAFDRPAWAGAMPPGRES